MDLVFQWDEHNQAHIARHRVTAAEVEQVFMNGAVYISEKVDQRSGETRFREIGETNRGRVLVVVWTVREGVRVVTAWPANRTLRAWYARIKES